MQSSARIVISDDFFYKLDDRSLAPFAFHINYTSLFEGLEAKLLIPKYELDGRPTNTRGYEEDDFMVYFASGKISELSKFLAGLALNRQFLEPEQFRNVKSPNFSNIFSIAFTDTSQGTFSYGKKGHDVITLYSPDGNGETVDLYTSLTQVAIQILPIPFLSLSPAQIATLRSQGSELFRSGNFYEGNILFKVMGEEQAADIYRYSKQQELSIRYALSSLCPTDQRTQL